MLAAIASASGLGAALWKLRAKGAVDEVPQVGDYKGWRLA